MGDMREDFDFLKKHSREVKRQRMKDNMRIINESKIDYEPSNYGFQLMFRDDDKPSADFYPSTNKWVVHGRVFYGTAQDFVIWWVKITNKKWERKYG